ncbi:MAG: hypothetical protein ACKOYH_07045, partial [Cyanobium sp.]
NAESWMANFLTLSLLITGVEGYHSETPDLVQAEHQGNAEYTACLVGADASYSFLPVFSSLGFRFFLKNLKRLYSVFCTRYRVGFGFGRLRC